MKQRDEVLGVKIVGGLPEAATPWLGLVSFFLWNYFAALVWMSWLIKSCQPKGQLRDSDRGKPSKALCF
jgi:hypothetical protein